ncbi:hypothetical protein LEMLEM_LOCUS9895 [Lemmus lemmus]
MWSCCFQFCGGSDLNNKKSRGHGGGHGGARWIWVHSWLQRLWPFGQKETTLNQGSQAQDHTDQVEKESAPKVPKEAAPEDMKEFVQNDPKVSGPNDPKESASKDTHIAQREPTKSPFKSRDLLLDNMVTSMQEEDRHALITFMCTSSVNSTIQYDCEGDEEVKKIHEGSDVKNEKIRGHGGGHGGAPRSQVHSWVQCLWPFTRKGTRSQDSQNQDQADQVEKESSLKEPAQIVLKTTDPTERKEFVPNNLEESGPKDAKECGPKEPRLFAPKEPKEFCFNTLDVLLDNMLTPLHDGDSNSVIAFLCIYPMCATVQQVLDVLFRR